MNSSPIGNYLGRYGFSIPIDRDVLKLVDDALSKPGAFYSFGRLVVWSFGRLVVWAFGRLGVIILIPAARLIVVAYSG